MKKKVWIWIVIPICIVILGITILLYKIDEQYMWSDEVFSFEAAKMLLQKGEPIYDSGLYYGRSSIYHQLLAWSMQLFGVNEFGSRVLNLPFLVGTSLLLYFAQIKKNWKLALSTSLLYITTNFTIALSRETRMYAMAQFVFFVLIISLYKLLTLLQEYIEKNKKIKELFTWKNLLIGTTTLGFGYLTYNTQPIAGILIIAVIAYFILLSILQKNWKYLLLSLFTTTILFAGIILRYETLNIFEWFNSLSPSWADTIVPTYYSVITIRNLPWIAISVFPILYLVFKQKKLGYGYVLSILVTFTIFLSLQPAQHERYWQLLIPIIIITAISSIWEFTKFLSGTKKKIFIIGSLLLITIPHILLGVKELTEIETYTDHSIYQYKKFQFNDVFDYLDQNLTEDKILIADYHSAMTLISKGYDVKKILVLESRVSTENREYEPYFHTQYLVYTNTNMEELKDVVIVIRNYEDFDNLGNYFYKINNFNKPVIYIN